MKYSFLQSPKSRRGFILPLALVLTVLILTVAGGITTLIGKELFFSRLARQSDQAYYMADIAAECAATIDDTYVGSDGNGIFEDPTYTATTTFDQMNMMRQARGIPTMDSITNIRCASVSVFDTDTSGFTVEDSLKNDGITPSKLSSYTMMMDFGQGQTGCAKVTVNKTNDWRQIISRGFNTCNLSSNSLVERAVVSTSER